MPLSSSSCLNRKRYTDIISDISTIHITYISIEQTTHYSVGYGLDIKKIDSSFPLILSTNLRPSCFGCSTSFTIATKPRPTRSDSWDPGRWFFLVPNPISWGVFLKMAMIYVWFAWFSKFAMDWFIFLPFYPMENLGIMMNHDLSRSKLETNEPSDLVFLGIDCRTCLGRWFLTTLFVFDALRDE